MYWQVIRRCWLPRLSCSLLSKVSDSLLLLGWQMLQRAVSHFGGSERRFAHLFISWLCCGLWTMTPCWAWCLCRLCFSGRRSLGSMGWSDFLFKVAVGWKRRVSAIACYCWHDRGCSSGGCSSWSVTDDGCWARPRTALRCLIRCKVIQYYCCLGSKVSAGSY